MGKVGRPTDYRDNYPELLLSIFKNKGDIADFCCEVMVTRDTFYYWLDKFPEFAEAYKMAKEFATSWLTKAGIEGMTAEKFNATTWSILMRNKCGYTEHRKIQSPLNKGANADEKIAIIENQVAAGELTAGEAQQLVAIVTAGVNVHAVTVIDERLKALEDTVNK